MTPEQIEILNQSILNLHLFCMSQICCDCPMEDNCRGYPNTWEIIKEGDESGK